MNATPSFVAWSLYILSPPRLPSHSMIDNADFSAATNVPFSDVLPKGQYLPEEPEREGVRDWVLSVCMDALLLQSTRRLVDRHHRRHPAYPHRCHPTRPHARHL